MKDRDPNFLSFRQIDISDLRKLLRLAKADRNDFFCRRPDWGKLYANRIICTALCQGGALHYLDSRHGLNDFDVYTFYAAHPKRHWYPKRLKSVDFGDPKFGLSEVSKPEFVGRRVDLMGRELPAPIDGLSADSLRSYLSECRTVTARELASKAVILLEPEEHIGEIIWPVGDDKVIPDPFPPSSNVLQ